MQQKVAFLNVYDPRLIEHLEKLADQGWFIHTMMWPGTDFMGEIKHPEGLFVFRKEA